MLIVQVVLLNLLIAIITASHHRIGVSAAMVAQYQRARLIVDLEPKEERPGTREAWLKDLARLFMPGWVRWLLYGELASYIQPRPRWLHVLLPPEQERQVRSEGKDVDPFEEQLNAIQRLLAPIATQQQEAMARSDTMLTAVESEVRTISRELDGMSANQAAIASTQRKLEESLLKLQGEFRDFSGRRRDSLQPNQSQTSLVPQSERRKPWIQNLTSS